MTPTPQDTPSRMYEFFVSYSRHDAESARAIHESFNLLGVPVWMAEAEILVEGRKRLDDKAVLHEILADAAHASRRCLVLLSSHALGSEWVKDHEVPPFLERAGTRESQSVWPVLVGLTADVVEREWPAVLAGKAVFELGDPANAGQLVREVCRAAGVPIPPQEETVGPCSPDPILSRQTVTTEHRRFAFDLTIGTEWIGRPPVGRGMLLNLANGETGLRLNLIVGAMPAEFRPKEGTARVEEANYFAEPFLARRIDFKAEFRQALAAKGVSAGRRGHWLLDLLRFKVSTAGTGRSEVLGSHVVNVLDHPHFAYTYRMRAPLSPAVIARKYSIILTPPGPGGDRYFEFVFTAGYQGDHAGFLRRVGRAESIVRSFRFVD
jgi:hypothetical protein